MKQETIFSRHIEILSPETARKIAAGEVADRPAALAREFIDNAIDAGAKNISLDIEGGGAKMLSLVDDGCGMSREDLALCWKTHATSKIRSVEDLNHTLSLGFRGEALSAAAAVSHLEIITSQDGREAFKLERFPGGSAETITAAHHTKGTTVRTSNLFDAIPARKHFLKRDGAEANLCKQVLIEKALAFPEIAFRFIQDGKLKLFLPAAFSLKERFAAAMLEQREASFLHEVKAAGDGFSITVVFGGPELFRRDRRQQFIIANGRRIQDFSFVQALEYGVEGWFPNGTHPLGAVYIEIDPSLADFNIHPAKREARFKDGGAIHHLITSTLKNFMHHYSVAHNNENSSAESSFTFDFSESKMNVGNAAHSQQKSFEHREAKDQNSFYDEKTRRSIMEEFLNKKDDFISPPRKIQEAQAETVAEHASYGEASSLKYRGRVFDLFIVVEKDQILYIIDQHAAHERILYNRFMKGPIPKQELLAPIPFETESDDDDRFLEIRCGELSALGLIIKKSGNHAWQIEALPAAWKLSDKKTVENILQLRSSGEDITRRWAATLACHAAIKDGDYLDADAALSLAEEALALSDPHCPHGRPLWTEMHLESLLKAVKRM
ncbi:MAG: DNA mismatch repair endonuclease MutL [Treponema sp.]|jgi:DNA mismatch repair protein MutL|nr:DNA mismatch repair endonuclease MutL [Treponema sp.]